MAANRETSSSTGIVFAKAKSEWVIPQRAKPGRKSSKVAVEPQTKQPTPSATASGSRDAQRAFRERKTEYVASLEARIESFEKGEIQRNVALQSTARAMKDENTKIKVELSLVRRELAAKEKEVGLKDLEVKRLEGALVEMRNKLGRMERLVGQAETKGYERGRKDGMVIASGQASGTSTVTQGSMRGSGSPVSVEAGQDNEDEELEREGQQAHRTSMMNVDSMPSVGVHADLPSPPALSRSRSSQQRMISLPSDDDENSISRQVAMDMACGFCEGIESVCVCRIVRETERNSRNNSNNHSDNDHMDDQSGQFAPGQVMGIVNPVTKQLSPTYHAEIAAAVKSTSILDNLPPVEAAVPLRRRQRQNNGTGNGQGNTVFGVKKAPIFAVSPAVLQDGQGSPLYIPPAECSGDPRNCPACKDDDFGREFCESLSKSMCNNEPGHRCENCPSEQAAKAEALAQTSVPLAINRTRSSVTSASSAARPARSQSQSGSDKISSSPTDIEAEYLDIKCCGNSKLCGTLDKNCGDDEAQPGHAHTHAYDGVQGEGVAGSAMPTGTWEEKISQLAPHGHEVDVTLSADEAWRTLKAHPNAKFASLAMLADVVARGTKCLGQPAPPTPSPRTEKPDPFATASIPKPRPIEQTVSTGSKRRRFEVHEYAVKQALAVLDAHPNHPLKKRRLSDLRGT